MAYWLERLFNTVAQLYWNGLWLLKNVLFRSSPYLLFHALCKWLGHEAGCALAFAGVPAALAVVAVLSPTTVA
jgi:hypothetical protein